MFHRHRCPFVMFIRSVVCAHTGRFLSAHRSAQAVRYDTYPMTNRSGCAERPTQFVQRFSRQIRPIVPRSLRGTYRIVPRSLRGTARIVCPAQPARGASSGSFRAAFAVRLESLLRAACSGRGNIWSTPPIIRRCHRSVVMSCLWRSGPFAIPSCGVLVCPRTTSRSSRHPPKK